MAKSSSWGSHAQELVNTGIALGVGFGIMGYILYTFVTALGASTQGGTFVNSILNAFSTAITTILPAVITIAFVVLLYVVVKSSGLLNRK